MRSYATFVYIYDAEGSPIGLKTRESGYAEGVWDTFWYEKNLQGDVVAVYSNSGTKLISYKYDAWGNILSKTSHNGGSSTRAWLNPILYRGYYYDSDISLYVLGTRYYDPATGRFINADNYISTGQGLLGNNMFAYCKNNPLMYIDNNGELPWHILIGGVVGSVIGAASAAVSGGDVFDVVLGAVSGFAGGALTASGVGIVGQVLGSASISMASNALSQVKNIVEDDTNEVKFSVEDMVFDGVVSGIFAYKGGNGASHGNTAGINASWKQLFKKGLSDFSAIKYFYKNAHNSNKEFVLTSLRKSTLLNMYGTISITIKNEVKEVFGW